MNQTYKRVTESETTLTELMIPSYANFSGKVHGGILLSLMDKIAYVCAAQHSGCYCVTVAVEGVAFINPVEVGELVSLKASVNYVGGSSMIVGIRIESKSPKTGVVKHTNSCYFTMVAKDETGKPTEVPGLILENDEQIRRFMEGKVIKSFGKMKRELLDNNLAHMSKEEKHALMDEEKCVIDLM